MKDTITKKKVAALLIKWLDKLAKLEAKYTAQRKKGELTLAALTYLEINHAEEMIANLKFLRTSDDVPGARVEKSTKILKP